jgi:hypothetical protein
VNLIKKGQTMEKGFALIEKTILQHFLGSDIYGTITGTWNQGYVHRRWRYLQF